jgi:hypothetical protein
MSDLILSIIASGNSDHPRFQVADPQQRFWTGDEWSDKEAAGRLYCSVNTACRAIQQILLIEHGGQPMRRFLAPVYLDLHSETELSLDQITDWLEMQHTDRSNRPTYLPEVASTSAE